MNRDRGLGLWAVVTLALAPLLLLALALAACGHSGTSSVAPTQAALPTWAPDASPSPAYTVTDQVGTTQAFNNVKCDGMDFTPLVDVEVSALAFFDGNGDGLRASHKVGIFDRDSKEQVLGALIAPDSTLEGTFRWESVEPVVLEAGKTYVVVGECDKPYDEEVRGRGDWAPELKSGRFWWAWSWKCPEGAEYGPRWVSSNFKFKPVSAP
jgi:hypothetical protein